MKKTRKFSNKFIDKEIAKIDAMFDRNQDTILYPEILSRDALDESFGRTVIPQSDKKEIKIYYNQLKELAYVRGFWLGWTLRNGLKEQK